MVTPTTAMLVTAMSSNAGMLTARQRYAYGDGKDGKHLIISEWGGWRMETSEYAQHLRNSRRHTLCEGANSIVFHVHCLAPK
jgi:hypothetical protein